MSASNGQTLDISLNDALLSETFSHHQDRKTMSLHLIGQIVLFGGDYAPRGWAFCHGQLLPIAANAGLFGVLGTTYGGDGTTTFALPDMRGRAPIGEGQGPGLSPYALGEKTGAESGTLTAAQLPAHSHLIAADASPGTSASPSGGYLAETSDGNIKSPTITNTYNTGAPANPVTLSADSVQPTGGGQPYSTLPPVIAMSYIIALEGIFPSRP